MSVDFRIIDFNFIFQDNVVLTPSTEDSNFPASNLKKFFRSKVWRTTTAATTQTLDIDLKTEEEIDSFCMFFDPVLKNRFTEDAVVKLQASATALFTSPPVDVTISIDDDNETFSHFFTTDQAYRFWRVTITDTTNPDGFLEVPKMFLGRKIQISKVPQTGFQMTQSDLSRTDTSLFGHEFKDVFPIRKGFNFNLIHMTKAQAEELFKSFIRSGNVLPVVIEVDAQEALFDKDRFLMYGRYLPQLQSQHLIREFLNHNISFLEAF